MKWSVPALLVQCPYCGNSVIIHMNKPLFTSGWSVVCRCGYSFPRDLVLVVDADSQNTDEEAQRTYGRIF